MSGGSETGGNLRQQIEQVLVQFDGVESKRLAADEIVNRVVGPELERLRTELARLTAQHDDETYTLDCKVAGVEAERDRLRASVRTGQRILGQARAERDAAVALLDRAVVLPEDWRDQIAKAFGEAWHYRSARAMVVVTIESWRPAETPEPTPRRYVCAKDLHMEGEVPCPNCEPAPESTPEPQPGDIIRVVYPANWKAVAPEVKVHEDGTYLGKSYVDSGAATVEIVERAAPEPTAEAEPAGVDCPVPTEANEDAFIRAARAPRVFRAGDPEPPADVNVLRDDWPKGKGCKVSYLRRAKAGGWGWSGHPDRHVMEDLDDGRRCGWPWGETAQHAWGPLTEVVGEDR